MSVHLSFDDGPDPIWTPRILEALRQAALTATFFVMTPAARRYRHLIPSILQDGHSIEFHCSSHIRHTDSSRHEIASDTRDGLQSLRELNVEPSLWRPPWGILAPWTTDIADDLSLSIALWTTDTHDWRDDSATEMLTNVEQRLAPGAVILMHDGVGPGATRSGCEETVALIPQLANRLETLELETAPLSPETAPPLEARWRDSA